MGLVRQKTLQKEAVISGRGLFSGEKSCLRLLPAQENSGLVFQTKKGPVSANIENVISALRTTFLKQKEASVGTVEHLLAALYALGISNLTMAIEGGELPILDGSAQEFADLILQAGIKQQNQPRDVLQLKTAVYVQNSNSQLVALPCDCFKISCLFESDFLKEKQQFLSFKLSQNSFLQNIASARTFSFYEEIKPLLDQGLIKGGNLENALLIRDGTPVLPSALRFKDECVRHKILDLIGDFALSGRVIFSHIIALRPGHSLNAVLVKKMLQKEKEEHEIFAVNLERN